MLNDEFTEAAKELESPEMGTEVIAPLIYNLIMFQRPRRVLEIGAGFTSLYILKALFDNDELIQAENRNSNSTSLINNQYYENEIRPAQLHVIDNVRNSLTTAGKLSGIAKNLGLHNLLTFHKADFLNYSSQFSKEELPFDLLWLDCGNLNSYNHFQKFPSNIIKELIIHF